MSAIFISRADRALVVALQGSAGVDTLRVMHDIVLTHLKTDSLCSVVFDLRYVAKYDEDAYLERERANEQLSRYVRRLGLVVSDPRHAFCARLLYPDLPGRVSCDDVASAIEWTMAQGDEG